MIIIKNSVADCGSIEFMLFIILSAHLSAMYQSLHVHKLKQYKTFG